MPWLFEGRLPDLNLGTAGGASCAPALRDSLTRGARRAIELQPRHRRPLQGRLHHAPLRPAAEGVHAIQLEMGLATYMDETRAALPVATPDPDRLARLRPVLRALLQTTLDWRPDGR